MKWPNDTSAASALALHFYGRHGIVPEAPLDDMSVLAEVERELNFAHDNQLVSDAPPSTGLQTPLRLTPEEQQLPEESLNVEEVALDDEESGVLTGIFVSSLYTEGDEASDDYTRHFFRFYETGYVIDCTVATADPEPPEWFVWQLDGMNRGRYSFDARTGYVAFETFNEVGSVYYEGVVLDRELKLNSHSYITGADATCVVSLALAPSNS